jgi:hypothetical protein
MKISNLHFPTFPAILFVCLSTFFSSAAADQNGERQPTFFTNSERISAAVELARLLGIEYRNKFDGRDRIVPALRYCGYIDEALKHDVKNVMFEMSTLTEALIRSHRGSYQDQFQSLSVEEILFAITIAIAEMQGIQKGVGISLQRWHPDLRQSDVLCKRVLEDAFNLPDLLDRSTEG